MDSLSLLADPLNADMPVGGNTAPPPGPTWFPGVIFADYFNLVGIQLIHQLKDWMTTPVNGLLPLAGTLDQSLKEVSVANVAGIGTRFLQHGLRVPDPADINQPLVDMKLVGLYEMTGQQFNVTGSVLDATVDVVAAPKISVTVANGKASLPFALTNPPTDNPLWHPVALQRIIPMPLTIMLRQGVKWAQPSAKWLLFGFSDPLQHELRRRSSLSLKLTSTDGTRAPAPVNGMEGLLIRFAISIVPELGSDTNVFQVSGTNEETRDLMEHLFANPTELAAAEVDLLLPAGAPNSVAGFKSTDGAKVMLLKTNLSSVGQPDVSSLFAAAAVEAAVETPLGPTHAVANTKPPTEFLRLLWECSVVHTGGFYLFVPDLKPNDKAFGGKKRLEIAAMVKKTGAADMSTVGVDTFHNAILVDATGLAAGDRVQAEVFERDAETPVTTPQPNFPAGTASFGASWNDAPVHAEAKDAATYAETLYQLLQYRVASTDLFDASPWSTPLGPQGTGTIWSYRRSAPASRYLKAPSKNRYAAIGQLTQLDMQLVDVFGNCFGLDPLAVTPVYNDRLIPLDEWPAASATYAFSSDNSGSAKLTVTIAFQADQIQHKQSAAQHYETVLNQLADPRVKVTSVTAMAAAEVSLTPDPQKTLIGFVTKINSFLQGTGQPPESFTLSGTVPTNYVASGITEDLFPIWVSMVTTRDVSWEQPAFDYPDGFVRATSPVPPLLGSNTTDRTAMRSWAHDFEVAYDGFSGGKGLLKVLVGKPPNKVSATGALLGKSPAAAVTSTPGDIWAVKWGAGVGVDVTFANDGNSRTTKDGAVYFAPLPLSTALINGTTDIYEYSSDGTRGQSGSPKAFHGIDLDGWARAFLRYVDKLLAPEMATAIAQIDGPSYAALLQAKEDLAYSISSHVDWVFEEQLQAAAGDKQAAQVRFRESLLASLGNDYSTSAIVQMPATVAVSGIIEQDQSQPPQLFGSVVPDNIESDTTLKQYTISTASLPIANADPTYLTFLTSVVHPTDKADLCLKFSYDIDFVDHRFQTTAKDFGYVPSSWLRFVLPDTDPITTAVQQVPKKLALQPAMGQLDIPIPLRAYPAPPHLIQQRAKATHDKPNTVDEALRWDFALTVQPPVAAQDDLHLTVKFNDTQTPPADRDETTQGDTLFDALARFQQQSPAIDLTVIREKHPNAKTWLSDVLTLVTDISKGWKQHVETMSSVVEPTAEPQETLPPSVIWNYILQVPDETTRTVKLTWNGAAGTAPEWPTIGGVVGTRQTPVNQKPITFQYQNIPLKHWDQLQIVWKDLEVAMLQSASTSAFIERNETLIGCGGQRTEQTNPAFVYTTAPVTFASPVIPLLNVSQKLKISDGSVSEAVSTDLIQKIVPSAPPRTQIGLSIGAEYTFDLAPQLTTNLPVLLAKAEVSNAPAPASGVESSADFGKRVAIALIQWHADFQPVDANASMRFDVTVFAANSQQPLARLLDVEAKIGPKWWETE